MSSQWADPLGTVWIKLACTWCVAVFSCLYAISLDLLDRESPRSDGHKMLLNSLQVNACRVFGLSKTSAVFVLGKDCLEVAIFFQHHVLFLKWVTMSRLCAVHIDVTAHRSIVFMMEMGKNCSQSDCRYCFCVLFTEQATIDLQWT